MLKCGRRYFTVALVFTASAILLFSCGKSDAVDTSGDESMMTEYSEDLTLVVSQNGRRSYLFETPLLEGYTLAREPYREFRKGVKITTYQDDSLSTVDAVLTANYAIYYENRDLWEAKGNVVARKPAEGKTLYTQQLFWNARTHRVYSNVDSKMVENEGRNVYFGESFESDEEFKDWKLRRSNVRMEVEMKINEADTTKHYDAEPEAHAGVERPPHRTAVQPEPQTQQSAAANSAARRNRNANGMSAAPNRQTANRPATSRPASSRQTAERPQHLQRPATEQMRPAPDARRRAAGQHTRATAPTSINNTERGSSATEDPKPAR